MAKIRRKQEPPTFSMDDAQKMGCAAVEREKRRLAREQLEARREQQKALRELRPEFVKLLAMGRKVLIEECSHPRAYVGVSMPVEHRVWNPAQVGAFAALARKTFPGFDVQIVGQNPELPVSPGNPVKTVVVGGTRTLPPIDTAAQAA